MNGGWAAIKLVASRELKTRLQSKAFKITTAALLILVVGFSVVFKLVGDTGGSKVGFTPSAAVLAQPLESLAGATDQKVTVSTVDQAAGEQQLLSGDLDALVTGSPTSFQVVVKKDLSSSLKAEFTVLLRQITLNNEIVKAGGNPASVNAAVEAATVDVRTLEPPREFQSQRLVLAIIVGVLVYVALLVYGPAVAQGVVEEKSSRIVEILLTTIRPWQLMVGKVLGIGVIGLAQLGVTAIVGVTVGLLTKSINFPSEIAASIAVWAVVWFLLGYLVYALVFAGLGALVSRQEDVGGVTAPAIMLIVLPYVLGISILPSDPDNQLMAALSLIPLFSPTLMPVRIALGTATAWQIALSIALTVLLAVGLIWLAGRIYSNAVLRTGSRVRLIDALRG